LELLLNCALAVWEGAMGKGGRGRRKNREWGWVWGRGERGQSRGVGMSEKVHLLLSAFFATFCPHNIPTVAATRGGAWAECDAHSETFPQLFVLRKRRRRRRRGYALCLVLLVCDMYTAVVS
jgi:hypothetical protein